MSLILLALAASAAEPLCVRLARHFDENERVMASDHDALQMELDDIRKALIKAGQPAGSPETRRLEQNMRDYDAAAAELGNNLADVMARQNCPLPNHVTSWYTYSRVNPNALK